MMRRHLFKCVVSDALDASQENIVRQLCSPTSTIEGKALAAMREYCSQVSNFDTKTNLFLYYTKKEL